MHNIQASEVCDHEKQRLIGLAVSSAGCCRK